MPVPSSKTKMERVVAWKELMRGCVSGVDKASILGHYRSQDEGQNPTKWPCPEEVGTGHQDAGFEHA